ncbi:MAG: hypothetical protein FWG50_09720 [Kiritimatiellaeota bacterium]|nr:hypothetical protein [Kiritimatiellota bacterium]
MGTSKSYGSPKWPGVNEQVGKAIADTKKVVGAIGTFADAYKQFINAETVGRASTTPTEKTHGMRGGGAGATARNRAAVAGAKLGKFLSSAASLGLGRTLEKFGFKDLAGKSLEEILNVVLDSLCGKGGLLDDSAMTEAMAKTLDELSKDTKTVEEFDVQLRSEAKDIEGILRIYYAHLLAINFEQKEGGFVREKISREECNRFFSQSRELIRTIVTEELSRKHDLTSLDWNSPEAVSIANAINHEVLNILIAHE